MPATHPEDRRQFLLYDGQVSSRLGAHLLLSASCTYCSQAGVAADTLLLCWLCVLRHNIETSALAWVADMYAGASAWQRWHLGRPA